MIFNDCTVTFGTTCSLATQLSAVTCCFVYYNEKYIASIILQTYPMDHRECIEYQAEYRWRNGRKNYSFRGHRLRDVVEDVRDMYLEYLWSEVVL